MFEISGEARGLLHKKLAAKIAGEEFNEFAEKCLENSICPKCCGVNIKRNSGWFSNFQRFTCITCGFSKRIDQR